MNIDRRPRTVNPATLQPARVWRVRHAMNGKRWAVVGLVALVGGVSLALALAPDDGGRLMPVSDPWLEIPASDVRFETLAGGTASVVDYTGRVVVLNFWGTWCPPCRREIPELVRLQEALGADGTVIGVAVHSAPEEIREFMEEFGVNYPVWVSDPMKGLAHFDAAGYPFTILVDPSGVIRRQYLGPQTVERLAADIEKLTGLSLTLPEPDPASDSPATG